MSDEPPDPIPIPNPPSTTPPPSASTSNASESSASEPSASESSASTSNASESSASAPTSPGTSITAASAASGQSGPSRTGQRPRTPEGAISGPGGSSSEHESSSRPQGGNPVAGSAATVRGGPGGAAPGVDDEPYRARWIFDNPSFGRALRYTFGDKRVARAVFVNALLLVIVLAVVQDAFGRGQLGLYSERISYGGIAFLGLVAVEAAVLSILAPLGLLNIFEAERREECFDQVVASGASPHRVIFGRFWASLAFLGIVLFSSLPFFATTIVLDGATPGQVATAYLVLASYAVCVCALSTAVAVALDDTALPVIVGLLALVVTLVAAVSRRAPPEFAAFSPVRHVVVGMADVALDLRLGTFAPPTPFGVEVPCVAVSLAMYAVLGFLGIAYAFVGPDLELTPGLDSFDSVTVSKNQEATRARRGVARTLLRAVQLRFFYENLSPRARALSPFVRAAATLVIFVGAHAMFLSAFWPSKPAKAYPDVEMRTVFPYLAFTFGTLSLLALSGAGARASLLCRTPVIPGPLPLGRFPVLFLLMAAALATPALLWWGAARFTGAPADVMLASQVLGLYAVAAGYAAFVFSVGLLMAMLSTNPYSATGWTLIATFAANLTPAVWIPLFTGNVAGAGSSFLLDLSPITAGWSVARPGDTFPFATFQGEQIVRHVHEPSWRPFAWFHGVVGLGCLVAGLVLARRELRARDGRS